MKPLEYIVLAFPSPDVWSDLKNTSYPLGPVCKTSDMILDSAVVQ